MKEYYYIDSDHRRCGPVDEQELAKCGVTPDTLVWTSGMADWTCAAEVVEPRYLAGGMVPPPVPPMAPPPVPPTGGGAPVKTDAAGCPPSYLPWAIGVTLLCCVPTGVVAIVYATKVRPQWLDGNHEGACKSSKNAKVWSIASAVTGVIGGIAWGMIIALS